MRIPSNLEAWATEVTLPGSGRRLFCYDAGPREAPALLMVHGLGDEADTWRRVIAPLSVHNRVIAPDLPGFGRSPMPAHAWLTPPYVARAVLELMRHLGLQGVTLVGSSLGAVLCQVVALAAPDLISRIVLVDGGIGPMRSVGRNLLSLLVPGIGERYYRGLADNLDAAYATLAPYYARLESLPEEERSFLRQRVGDRVASRTQMRAYFSLLRGFVGWMLVSGRRAHRRSSALGIPVSYVWGAEDHIVPVEAGRVEHAQHPGSRLVIIPDAGHLPQQETPGRFAEVLKEAMALRPSPIPRTSQT